MMWIWYDSQPYTSADLVCNIHNLMFPYAHHHAYLDHESHYYFLLDDVMVKICIEHVMVALAY